MRAPGLRSACRVWPGNASRSPPRRTSASGRTAARFETEYQLLFTNRLILQPLLDLWLYGRDDVARGIGAGLSSMEFELRLRYEFTRQFAPYAGVEWERACGDTASLRRAGGQGVTATRFVLGLRTWF